MSDIAAQEEELKEFKLQVGDQSPHAPSRH